VRQLVSRARERVKHERPRFAVAPGAHERLLAQFLAAVQAQDGGALAGLLTRDAAFISDAGGKRPAALRVVTGAEEVAKLLIHLTTTGGGAREIKRVSVNGAAGLWVVDYRGFENVVQIETDGARIARIYVSRNPDKLAHLELH
jgi:RNA polymerase sigma-70 factor (ECF subfamily)